MWSRIDNPEIIDKRVTIDYMKVKDWEKTRTYGLCDIYEEIKKVEAIYKENFDDFNYRWPEKDELLVVNVEKSVNCFKIIRINEKPDLYFNNEMPASAMIDTKEDKIILPSSPYRRTERQAINHELGHWFFDRIGDEIANNYKLESRKNIDDFEDYYSELAAFYCEIKLNRNREILNNYWKKQLDRIIQEYKYPLIGLKEEIEKQLQ